MSIPADLKDAADHLLSHAHGMRAVLVLAEHVQNVSALEGAAGEAERRRDTATADMSKIEARVKAAKSAEGELARLEGAAKLALSEAQKRAAEIIAEAQQTADGLAEAGQAAVAAAKADAAAILAEAQGGADAKLVATREAIEAAEKRLAELNAEAAEAATKADQARAYIASLTGA